LGHVSQFGGDSPGSCETRPNRRVTHIALPIAAKGIAVSPFRLARRTSRPDLDVRGAQPGGALEELLPIAIGNGQRAFALLSGGE
jgi:hypothetical protein